MEIRLSCFLILGLLVQFHYAQVKGKDKLTCGPPPKIQYASLPGILFDTYPVGFVITYKCQLGFTVIGNNTAECIRFGQNGTKWSQPKFICTDISCDPPENPDNGLVMFSSLSVGSLTRYDCDIGYEPKSTNPILCRADGTWNETMECIAISCDPPETIRNGQVIYSSVTYGSELQYYCEKGFKRKNNNTVFCTSDGTWSEMMECIAITCKEPGIIKNGLVILSSLNFGAKLQFYCDNGFKRKNKYTIFCTSEGTWSEVMECVAITCDPPENPMNGRVIYSSLNVGSQLQIECEKGFKQEDRNPISCTTDGIWNGTMECIEIFCDPPGNPENGHVTHLTLSIGSRLQFVCNKGFKPVNKNAIFCTDEGVWSETMECIAITCDPPENPMNGRVIYSSLNIGSQLQIECEKGFKRKNEDPISCTSEGTWSGVMECNAISCDLPEIDENAHLVNISIGNDSQLVYECEDGFFSKYNETIYCTENGTWSQTPECITEVMCELPIPPDNGLMEIEFEIDEVFRIRPRPGDTVMYSCAEDLFLHGSAFSECQDNGKWTFPTPVCLEPCSVPFVSNGEIGKYVPHKIDRFKMVFKKIDVGTPLQNNEKLFLHCAKGYRPLGTKNWQEKVVCNNGKWSDDPVCTPVRCSVSELKCEGCILNEVEYYADGEFIKIECENGYENVKGDSSIKCEGGSWKQTMLPCIPASCQTSPPEIENGQITNKALSYSHNTTVMYLCEDSYILIGDSQVQCLFGEWTGEPPICEENKTFPRGCVVNNIKNGYITKLTADKLYFTWSKFRNHIAVIYENIPSGSIVPENSRVYLLCEDGYTPKNSVQSHVQLSCLKGQWVPDAECLSSEDFSSMINSSTDKPSTINPLERSTVDGNESISTLSTVNIEETTPLSEDPTAFTTKPFIPTEITEQNLPEQTTITDINSVVGTETINPELTSEDESLTTTISDIDATDWNTALLTELTSEDKSLITTISYIDATDSNTELLTENYVPSTITPVLTTVINDNQTDSIKPSSCSCILIVDDETIIAYAEHKKLEGTNMVEKGDVVKFRCRDIGFYELIGQPEFICQDCKTWHSSDISTCLPPKRGNSVILFGENAHITLNGTLEIKKGEEISLICIAIEFGQYPTWKIPSIGKANITEQKLERSVDIIYASLLSIKNSDAEDEGSYLCSVRNFLPTTLNIHIVSDTCKELEQNSLLLITYTNGVKIGSLAHFRCLEPRKLNGASQSRCLESGEWSNPIPTCVRDTCKELEQNYLLLITYTNGLEVGSLAHFRCLDPSLLSGSTESRCLAGGMWLNPIPKCVILPCVIPSLMLSLNVIPNYDKLNSRTVPYKSTVTLTCLDKHMTLIGDPVAKCGMYGEWEDTNAECLEGCHPISKIPGSSLIIQPIRNSPEIGDTVTFSCPPGQKLTTDVEVMMCLSSGWSERTLPNCEEVNEYDY